MIRDALTVLWKEWRELMNQGGRLGGLRGSLIFVAVFGIYQPWQFGPDWVRDQSFFLYWAWVPFMLVMRLIVDSFAGERERHTLETLLSTRLSDTGILAGKLAMSVGYGWGTTMASVLLGLVSVNLIHARGGPVLMFPAAALLGILLISLLISLLAAAGGIIISLRSPTVRHAYQTMTIYMMLLGPVPLVMFQLLPAGSRTQLVSAVAGLAPGVALCAGLLVLGVLDAVLLIIARRRFRRSRLILD